MGSSATVAADSASDASTRLPARFLEHLARYRRSFLVAIVAAVFMSAIGAFDTGRQALPHRLLFWLILLVGGTFLGMTVMSLARAMRWWNDRSWVQATLLTLMVWAPATLMTWAVISLMVPGAGWRIENLIGNALPVLTISAAMTALNYLADREPNQTHAATQADAAPPAFLDRLPPPLRGGELYAVEAEDHYLRLHTSKGADLILMRLSDAIDELEGIEGAQTHRSWWVAREGIDDARRADGRATLRLKNGAEVPVSRTYVRALRQAGWF
jgi:DNA-binding LytR/AlgR family response regulator